MTNDPSVCVLVVQGDMVHDTAVQWAKWGKTQMEKSGASGDNVLRYDLSGVAALDSSALAVLLDWYRYACQLQRNILFCTPPERLWALIQLSRLDTILPFAIPSVD